MEEAAPRGLRDRRRDRKKAIRAASVSPAVSERAAPMFRMDNPPLPRSRGLPDNSHRGAFYCREEGDQAGIEPGPGRTRSAEIEVRAVLHSEADAQNCPTDRNR